MKFVFWLKLQLYNLSLCAPKLGSTSFSTKYAWLRRWGIKKGSVSVLSGSFSLLQWKAHPQLVKASISECSMDDGEWVLGRWWHGGRRYCFGDRNGSITKATSEFGKRMSTPTFSSYKLRNGIIVLLGCRNKKGRCKKQLPMKNSLGIQGKSNRVMPHDQRIPLLHRIKSKVP